MFSLSEDVDAESALATVVELVRRRLPRCGEVRVVSIDGPSGAGKSTFAAALAQRLAAPVVRMDDLYPGWDGLGQAVPLVFSQLLEPLSRGEAGAFRRWDWPENHWAETMVVPVTPIVVLEGVGSSVRPAGDFATVRVWVDADLDVRMRRGIERDGEAYRPHWQRWARQEADLFATDGTRARADVVVDTTALP